VTSEQRKSEVQYLKRGNKLAVENRKNTRKLITRFARVLADIEGGKPPAKLDVLMRQIDEQIAEAMRHLVEGLSETSAYLAIPAGDDPAGRRLHRKKLDGAALKLESKVALAQYVSVLVRVRDACRQRGLA
jgi:hypothetical protein